MKIVWGKCIFILMLLCGFSSLLTASNITVSSVEDLLLQSRHLENVDTFVIEEGVYHITSDLDDNGLVFATSGWAAYSELAVIGRGDVVLDFNGSYGILVYKPDNLLFQNLTLRNATNNGGVYVKKGHVNFDNITIENCSSVTPDTITEAKTEAHGGAIYFDANSSFSFIRDCSFVNNSAENCGGAISIHSSFSSSSLEDMIIENCIFRNNSSLEGGSAIHVDDNQQLLYITNNAIYNNNTSVAVYINGSQRVTLTNNSIAKNSSGGVYIDHGMRTACYFNNNSILDNSSYDVSASYSNTYINGNYNVIRDLYNVSYNGLFNDDVIVNDSFYYFDHDSLKALPIAQRYLLGRIPGNATSEFDLYGQTRLVPSDIGAINIADVSGVAIWTGEYDQDFSNTQNWMRGVMPSDADLAVISSCDITNYPIVDNSVTSSNGGDLSNVDMIVSPNGIIKNEGQLVLQSLVLESQNGGSGQLLNLNTINCYNKATEYYLGAETWTPIYLSDNSLNASTLFNDLVYGNGYDVKLYDEYSKSLFTAQDTYVFDGNSGSLIKTATVKTASFASTVENIHDFTVQHTLTENNVFDGFNLVGNPFEVNLSSEQIVSDNMSSISGAIYVYNGSSFDVWVDGIGDEGASEVQAHEAFYVQALDTDPLSNVDELPFQLSVNEAIIVNNPSVRSTLKQTDAILNIELLSNSGYTLDKTYIRFTEESTEYFDSYYDALKMPRLLSESGARLSTANEEQINYAVNSLAVSVDSFASVSISIDKIDDSSSATANQLYFTQDDSDDVAYLLHDAFLDSSESVILNDNYLLEFDSSVDSITLANRFSLQVFAGEVPFYIESTLERYSEGFEYFNFSTPAVSMSYDTVSELTNTEILHLSNDTTLMCYSYTDTVLVDTQFVSMLFVDTVFYDSVFHDTVWVLGTYDYLEVDTVSSYVLERYNLGEELDSLSHSKHWYSYMLIDTLISTPVISVPSTDNLSIYSSHRSVVVESSSSEPADVLIYDMNGKLVFKYHLPNGNGDFAFMNNGVFLVNLIQGDRSITQKLMFP